MANKLKLKFVKDEPILEDSDTYFDFYHKSFVPALTDILDISNGVRTIGLFGGWGTGKSTVIRQLEKNESLIVLTFDVWKYKDDALRRAFLIYLYDELKRRKHIKASKALEQEIKGLYVSTEVSKEEEVEEDEVDKKWWQKIVEFVKTKWQVLGLLALGFIWLFLRVFFPTNEFLNALRTLTGYLMFSAPVWWIFQKTSEKVLSEYISKIFNTYDPLVKTQTITEKRNALNSPEQFELLFSKILSKIKSDKKLVAVFDNLDRVEGKFAVQVLTTIKTFLEPTEIDNVVFVIPCDYNAVRKQIVSNYADSDPDEFLRKLFGVSLWTPDFILSDLEEYTRKLIQQTGDDEGIVNKEEVISVITKAFSKNPRQIKQFINNFVALLYVASNTNASVWDEIKKKTEYLAKVLIIKQHYPMGYERLKQHWFEPEQIYLAATKDEVNEDPDEIALRDFMLKTKKFSVVNAKPFIYFKKPFKMEGIQEGDELQQAFLQNSVEKAIEIIKKQNNQENVASFITGLYSEYELLNDELVQIVNTHLKALSSLSVKFSSQQYLQKTINLIDDVIWNKFLDLPTSKVFEQLINFDDGIVQSYRKRLIERYADALSGEEFAGDKNSETAIEIVRNILALPNKIISKDAKQKTREGIEKNLKSNYQLLNLFTNEEMVDQYLTEQTLAHVVTSVSVTDGKHFLPLVVKFSKQISKLPTLLASFIDTITQLSTSLAGMPEYPTEKALLISEISNSLHSLKSGLGEVDKERLNKLSVELYKVVRQIPNVDNKKDALLGLFILYSLVDDPHQSQIKEQLNSFIQTSTPTNLDSFLEILDQRGLVELFVTVTSPHLQGVFRTRLDCRQVIYQRLSDHHKTTFLVELVTYADDLGLPFLESLTGMPDRQAVVSAMLSRLSSLSHDQSAKGYLWVVKNMKVNDGQPLKESLSNNILLRAKVDDNRSGELSYRIYEASEMLGNARRSEIAENVLRWLREDPARPNSNHGYALKIPILAARELPLPDPSKRDLAHLILSKLRKESNAETLNTLVEALKELKPAYADNEESFDNLLVALKDWQDDENRRKILDAIPLLKPSSMKKKEKGFWKEIEQIKNVAQ